MTAILFTPQSMICSLCGEHRPDAETMGHHLMRDHGLKWPIVVKAKEEAPREH